MSSFLVVPLVTQPAEADLAAGKTSRSDFGLIPEFCVINMTSKNARLIRVHYPSLLHSREFREDYLVEEKSWMMNIRVDLQFRLSTSKRFPIFSFLSLILSIVEKEISIFIRFNKRKFSTI